jgi:hypothetical protein
MRTKTNLIALTVAAAFGAVAGSAIAAPSTTADPAASSPSTGTYGSPSSGSSPSSAAPDAGMSSSGAGGAAAPNPANDAEFAKLDKDHKGYITKKDAAKNKELVKKFDTLDMNHDGKLDQAEFAQFEVAPAGKGKTDKISK